MFNIDDRFYGSEPVMKIPRAQRLAAVGLWTLAGAWSAHFEKDGYVPDHMLEELGGTPELIELLIDVAKLWRRRRGGGIVFIDWPKWQQTRAQKEARRSEWRERKSRERSKSADKPGDVHEDVTRDSPPPVQSSSSGTGRTIRGQSEGDLGSDGSQVHNPVDNRSEYAKLIDSAARYLTGIAGETISKLQAGTAVDLILERGGRRVRNPERYVMGTLRKSGPEWLQYIFTGKEPE